jgi:sialate O-acetylesterase
MKHRLIHCVSPIAGLAVLLACTSVWASSLRLPAILGDHMVLQADKPVPIWGWSEAGTEVTVSFADQSAKVVADAHGRWRTVLPPMPASDTPRELAVTAGGERLVRRDVLVGEVWLCSGQSNMAMKLAAAEGGNEAAQAATASMRFFTVPNAPKGQPQDDCEGQWVVGSPEAARQFSAVGYFFGHAVQGRIDRPIGLINASIGGTAIQSWMSWEVLEAGGRANLETQRRKAERFDRAALEAQLAPKMQQEIEAAQGNERQIAAIRRRYEKELRPPDESPTFPASNFNGLIHPLIPYAMRGVIWYQGENNVGGTEGYRHAFAAFAQDWRSRWGQGDFPIYLVQLAAFDSDQPTAAQWAHFRDVQRKILDHVTNTGLAVAIDVGSTNIHPKMKREVGERLALWALAHDYGQADIIYSGPLYDRMQIDGDRIRIHFHHTGDGLSTTGGAPTGFLIAGEDQQFVPAVAAIDGHTVVVHSPTVAAPVAVRYAWDIAPSVNLINSAGLPASPFRTDDWRFPYQRDQ